MQWDIVMVSEKAFENKVKIRNNVEILIQNIEILKLELSSEDASYPRMPRCRKWACYKMWFVCMFHGSKRNG